MRKLLFIGLHCSFDRSFIVTISGFYSSESLYCGKLRCLATDKSPKPKTKFWFHYFQTKYDGKLLNRIVSDAEIKAANNQSINRPINQFSPTIIRYFFGFCLLLGYAWLTLAHKRLFCLVSVFEVALLLLSLFFFFSPCFPLLDWIQSKRFFANRFAPIYALIMMTICPKQLHTVAEHCTFFGLPFLLPPYPKNTILLLFVGATLLLLLLLFSFFFSYVLVWFVLSLVRTWFGAICFHNSDSCKNEPKGSSST